MVWVTGVSSNQDYNITIEYTDSSGIAQTPLSYAISVGTTTSNISLNWVASQIQSNINGSTDFTAVQYNNAVYFYSTTSAAFFITNIEVDNTFDTTSYQV